MHPHFHSLHTHAHHHPSTHITPSSHLLLHSILNTHMSTPYTPHTHTSTPHTPHTCTAPTPPFSPYTTYLTCTSTLHTPHEPTPLSIHYLDTSTPHHLTCIPTLHSSPPSSHTHPPLLTHLIHLHLHHSDYTLYLDGIEQQSARLPGFSFQLPTVSANQPVLFLGGIDRGTSGFQEIQDVPTFRGCLKDFGYNYR